MKILDKIKEFFVGKDHFDEKAKKIMRKKIINEDKIILLNAEFLNCLDNELENEAIMATLEMHYEEFMIDGVKHEHRYNSLLNYERDMLATIYVKYYAEYLSKLLEKCDLTLLSEKDLYLINKTKALDEKYNIKTYEFKNHFKGMALVRSEKSLAIEEFIKDVKNNCLEKKEINKTEEIDEIFSL